MFLKFIQAKKIKKCYNINLINQSYLRCIMNVVNVSDLMIDDKTWKQENLEQKHNIPLYALVEIMSNGEESEKDGLRLFVTGHTRDCDGTPLYVLSTNRNAFELYNDYKNKIDQKEWLNTPDAPYAEGILKWRYHSASGSLVDGMDESSLKIIKLP